VLLTLNPPSSEVDDVYNAIENKLKSGECYRLDRSKVTGAAIEFIVILTSAAAVATIANFLYQIWKDHKDKGQLYVAVDPDKDVHIMISENTSEIEIEEFQRKINKIYASGQMSQLDRKIIEEIKYRKIWMKKK